MMNPLVSIVVPVFNQAQYIEDCLRSVSLQRYANWECIIVNDGSTDNSESIIEKYISGDSRFKYFFKRNSGVCDTKNFGISKAQGIWILPLDADDIISNDYLELASKHFEEEISIIYSEAEFFEEKTGKWNLPEFSLEKMAYQNIIFNSAFFKKSDWKLVGGYDSRLIHGMEDWDLWLSILDKTEGSVKRINKICFYYRIKKGSRSQNLNRRTYTETLKIIDNKHLDFFQQYLPSYHRILYDNRDLKKVLNSKKYKFIDKIFKIIGR